MEPSEEEETIPLTLDKNASQLPPSILNSLTSLCNQENCVQSSKILLDHIIHKLPKSSTDVELPKGISFILKKLLLELSKDGVKNNACYETFETLVQRHSQIIFVIFPIVKVVFPTEDKNPLGYLLARGALTKSNALLTNNDLLKVIISDIGAMDYKELNHIAGHFLFDLILKDADGTIVTCAWNAHKNTLIQPMKNLTTCLKWLSIGLSKPEFKKYKIIPEEFYTNIFSDKGFQSLCTAFKVVISSGANIYPIIETYYQSFISFEDEKFHKKTDDECPGLDKMVKYCVSYIPKCGENFSKITKSAILLIKHLLSYLKTPAHIVQVFPPHFLGFLLNDASCVTTKVMNAIDDLVKAIFENFIPEEEDDPNCVILVSLVKQLVLASGYVKLNNDNGSLSKKISKGFLTMGPQMILSVATNSVKIFQYKTMDELHKFEPNAILLTDLLSDLLFRRGLNTTDNIQIKADVYLLIHKFCCLKLSVTDFSKVHHTLINSFFTSLSHCKKLEDLVLYLRIILNEIKSRPIFYHEKVDSKIDPKFEEVYQQAANNAELNSSHQLTVMASAHTFMIYQLISDIICPRYSFETLDLLNEILHSKTSDEKCLKEDSSKLTDDLNWVEATMKLCIHCLNHEGLYWKKFVDVICRFMSPFIKPSAVYIIMNEFKCYQENNKYKNHESHDDTNCANDDNDRDSDDDDDDDDDGDDDGDNNDDEISQVKAKGVEIMGNATNDSCDIDLDKADPDELRRLDTSLGALLTDAIKKGNKKISWDDKYQHRIKMTLMKYCLRISEIIGTIINTAVRLDILATFIEPLLQELCQASQDRSFSPLMKVIRRHLQCILKRASHPLVKPQMTLDLKEEMTKLFLIRYQLEKEHRKEMEMGYIFYLNCGIKLSKFEENKKGITDELYELFAQHTEAMIMNCQNYSPYALEKPLRLATPSTSILLHKIVVLGFNSSLSFPKRGLCLELICYSFQQPDTLFRMPLDKFHDICNLITKGLVKDFSYDIAPSTNCQKYLLQVVDMIKILNKKANKYSEITINFTEIMDAIVTFTEKFPELYFIRLRRSLEELKGAFKYKSIAGSKELRSKKRFISKVVNEEVQITNDNEIINENRRRRAASFQKRLDKVQTRIDHLQSKLPQENILSESKFNQNVKALPKVRIAQRKLKILEAKRDKFNAYLNKTPKTKKAPKQRLFYLGVKVHKKKRKRKRKNKHPEESQRKKRKQENCGQST